MKLNLPTLIKILKQTPIILKLKLSELPESWLVSNEGENTWSPFDVVGHLIHGEKEDWMTRSETIIDKGTSETFKPFDRFAQFTDSQGKSIEHLLNEFQRLRQINLNKLKELKIDEKQLELKGTHPEFGEVTLKELLATWAVHDLNHLNQINRVLAKQLKNEVGPWQQYQNILK